MPNFATDSAAAVAPPELTFRDSIAARGLRGGRASAPTSCQPGRGLRPVHRARARLVREHRALQAAARPRSCSATATPRIGGRIPVNPSGGLACFGEAVPAQALAQVCEVTWQLRGQADGPPGRGRHASASPSTRASSATAAPSSSRPDPSLASRSPCERCDHRSQTRGMAVQLNHTIVHAPTPEASAAFLSEMLGLGTAAPLRARSTMVRAGQRRRRSTSSTPVASRIDSGSHYAFLVSEDEFDEIFGRIQERGLDYCADPHEQRAGRDQPRRRRPRRLLGRPRRPLSSRSHRAAYGGSAGRRSGCASALSPAWRSVGARARRPTRDAWREFYRSCSATRDRSGAAARRPPGTRIRRTGSCSSIPLVGPASRSSRSTAGAVRRAGATWPQFRTRPGVDPVGSSPGSCPASAPTCPRCCSTTAWSSDRTRARPTSDTDVDREEADRILRDAMASLGTPVVRRWLMWTAVILATAFSTLRPRWRWAPLVAGHQLRRLAASGSAWRRRLAHGDRSPPVRRPPGVGRRGAARPAPPGRPVRGVGLWVGPTGRSSAGTSTSRCRCAAPRSASTRSTSSSTSSSRRPTRCREGRGARGGQRGARPLLGRHRHGDPRRRRSGEGRDRGG